MRQFFVNSKSMVLVGVLSSIVLMGCDKGPNLADICETSPAICNKIKPDDHCKKERNATIVADYKQTKSKLDEDKYQLLLAYENYKQCMGLASKIEHIKLKEKKTARINNYVTVVKLIEKLSEETKNSDNPKLLYYHWTRHLDESALEKFLKQEGTPALENPESQLHLATYYSKKDQNKTLQLLFHALELTKDDEAINPEIFHSLTSIFADKKEYKQAYIWLKVLQLYKPDDAALNEQTLQAYVDRFKLDRKFLDKVAATTLDKIEQGKFKSPRF